MVHLSGIEQSLLYLLASRAGRVVSREEILDAIWGTDFVAESNIVDRHVRSLRIKLQNDYRHPRFIATVPARATGSSRPSRTLGWRRPRTTASRPPTESPEHVSRAPERDEPPARDDIRVTTGRRLGHSFSPTAPNHGGCCQPGCQRERHRSNP